MKIAHFTDTYLPQINGVAFSTRTSALQMSKRQTVRVYAPANSLENGEETEGNLKIERYASVPSLVTGDLRVVLVDFYKLYQSLKEFDPDIVNVHTPSTLGMAGLILAKRLKKPVVGTYHTLLSEMGGYVSPLRVLPGGRKMMMKNNCGEQKESVFRKVVWSATNKLFEQCDVTVAESNSVSRELIRGGFKGRVETLFCGIDTSLFPVKKNYAGGLKVLHVGRLGFEKNVEVVIKAFGEVVKKIPNATLKIVGDGPMKESLEEMTAELGLFGKVNFVGAVKREKLGSIYRESDVFVTASTIETLGLVILEAMLSGLPVVGVKKYAIPDLVKNGRNGYVVRPYDVKAMSEAVAKILEDGKLQMTMGSEGRKAAEGYGMEIGSLKEENLYKSLIERKSRFGGRK
jgi:glycosyltransferase involved in cell wall biosynthesis